MASGRKDSRMPAQSALLVLLPLGFLGAAPALAGRADPMGFWMTEDQSAMVDIVACGPMLCGTIAWSEKTVDAKGRPLCGRAILGELMKTGPDSWDKGWIYAPKADEKYPVALSLAPDGSLALHVSAGLLGRNQTWTRPAKAPAVCSP
jgi:uncharacterized protein (DUF2147 family)